MADSPRMDRRRATGPATDAGFLPQCASRLPPAASQLMDEHLTVVPQPASLPTFDDQAFHRPQFGNQVHSGLGFDIVQHQCRIMVLFLLFRMPL